MLLNIALCDDMLVLCEILEAIIHEYELKNNVLFHIEQFQSGEELLAKFEKCHTSFDLYFLDNYMQKLTGVETALYIRQYNTSCNIVFVTSYDLQREFKAAAPLKILHKPIDMEEIFKVLDEILIARQCG